jgi:hypothetical protein
MAPAAPLALGTLAPLPTGYIPLREAVPRLCQEYADYLGYPRLVAQETDRVVRYTDGMLARLEEAHVMADTVKHDLCQTRETLLPAIMSNMDELQSTFARVDRLEEVIASYELSMNALEAQLVAVEESRAVVSLAKVFSFLGAGTSSQPSTGKVHIPVAAHQLGYVVSGERAQEGAGSVLPPSRIDSPEVFRSFDQL